MPPVSPPCVVDTGGKFATGVNETGGKFAAGINNTGGKLPPVSTTPAENLPPVSTTPVANKGIDIRYLKVNLKAKMYTCVNSTIQRCPKKIIIIFLIEDLSHLPPVSTTPVVKLELQISPRIFEKTRNGPNGILWGWGVTD